MERLVLPRDVLARGSKVFLARIIGAFAAFLLAVPGAAETPDPGVTAFIHVNVVPMDSERVLRNQSVVVREGRIDYVGPEIALPPGARVIDGHGTAFLSPGLADMHTHSASKGDLAVCLASGVTSVLNMGGASSDFVGQVLPAINAGRLPGPHVYISFRVDGSPRYGQFVVRTPEEAREIVRLAKTNGYDFIKVYNDLSPECFDAIIDEGKRIGVPVVGHGVSAVGLEKQLAAEQVLVAHLEEYLYTVFPMSDRIEAVPPDSAFAAVVDMTKRSGAYVTADLFTFGTMAAQWGRPEVVQSYLQSPSMRYLAPAARMNWPDAGYAERSGSLTERFHFLRRFARALHDAGVPLVAGTDAPTIPGVFAGVSLHEDLQALVKAGFTNFESLSTATRIPGEFIRQTLPSKKPFGILAPGMRADLILSRANPLGDLSTLRSPQGVMVAGHWYDAAALHRLLMKTSARYDRASLPARDGAESTGTAEEGTSD